MQKDSDFPHLVKPLHGAHFAKFLPLRYHKPDKQYTQCYNCMEYNFIERKFPSCRLIPMRTMRCHGALLKNV